MSPSLIRSRIAVLLCFGCTACGVGSAAEGSIAGGPDMWRAHHLIIDLHQHIDCTTQRLARAVKIMDAAGVGIGVNLTAGTVTRGPSGAASEFEQNKRLADA